MVQLGNYWGGYMNFLRTLAEAIRKRSLGVELTSVEKAIYEQAYCDCLGKNNTDFNRDGEVYNYYCNLFEYNIRKSDMVPFRVFNTLLNSDGKSLSLVDFCKLCRLDATLPDIRSTVIDNINSWSLQEYIYDEDFCGNPLITISGTDIKIENKTSLDTLNFAIVTGVSIGGKCINEDGSIDEEKLYDSLIEYINFKNQLVSDVKDVSLSGIIFMGDLFDVFSSIYALGNTNKRVMDSLVKKLENFGKKNKSILKIDIPFVGIVGGHNDSWFGDGFKTAVKVFGEDVMYLGKYGPCTMIKNDYSFFSKYLYSVYSEFSNGNRSSEGRLCYFIPNTVASELKVESGSYDVTICKLGVDGLKVVDYDSHTITYKSEALEKSQVKLKK